MGFHVEAGTLVNKVAVKQGPIKSFLHDGTVFQDII